MYNKELSERYGAALERVEGAVKALKEGRGVLLVDDENRENEGDLIFSAEKITVPNMALMIRECSGIVCLCITSEKAAFLGLSLMVSHDTSRYGTNFTTSVEAAEGVTTGVSASDRVTTIKVAISPTATPASISKPGHVFPLIAKDGGVFERDGHTEGSVDLMKLAGLQPSAILCELTNIDGTMAKLPEIISFATKYDYPVVSILDIIEYRKNTQSK